MRELLWSDDALRELEAQLTYIAADNPHAAESVRLRIGKAAEGLCFMATGRRGRVSGTYEKVVRGLPYTLAYLLDDTGHEQKLVILHVIHQARNWPPERWPR